MKKNLKRGLAVTVAMATVMGSVVGCSKGEEEKVSSDSKSGLEEVTLTWYIPGNGPQVDTDKVEEAIYEYLKDDLNVRIDFVECDWGSYDDKVQMAIASQEAFDLCYTAHWSNNFYNNVSKNAFLELEDLLDEYGKELKDSIPEAGWNAASVGGHIYAVPNMQIWAYQGGIGVETSYLEKYNFDLSKVTSLKEMEPLFEQIKKDNPEMYPIVNSGPAEILNNYQNTMGYEELAGSKIPGALVYANDELEVVNQYELPEMKEFFDMMYDWNQKGYFRSDAATVTDDSLDIQIGKSMAKYTSTCKPGVVQDTKAKTGKDFTYQSIGTPHLTTSGITATLTAVSRTSKNPERAIMFLEKLNTDKELYNMVCFGLEGEHYTKDGNYAVPVENSAYNPNQDWVYGNQFNALYREGQGENDWADTEALNNSAEPSPVLGFSFDSTTVQTELASISAVVDEYYLSLATGGVNPDEVLPEFLSKLEQAGSKKLIEECQRQLNEWLETK